MCPDRVRPNRPLTLVSLASLGWAVSFGVGAPLSSLVLERAGHDRTSIGLNTSLYYLGVALTALVVPALMRRANRACVVAGMVLDAVTTAAFPYVSSLWAWHALRLVGGVGTALSIIPMETLVNRASDGSRRGRDFGVYAFCVALGIGVGSALGLAVFPVMPKGAFVLGGLVTLLSVSLAVAVLPARMDDEADARSPVTVRPREVFLSLGTAWVQGFMEGGTLTFLSLYLLSMGHSPALTGGLLAAMFAGVVLAQLPLSALADRVGRLRMLLGCHATLVVGLLLLGGVKWVPLMAVAMTALGACCGALYPLGLALLGERVPASELARANAWYLAANCAGSLSGPLAMGLVIDRWGLGAQFPLSALAATAVVGAGSALMRRREACEVEARRAA